MRYSRGPMLATDYIYFLCAMNIYISQCIVVQLDIGHYKKQHSRQSYHITRPVQRRITYFVKEHADINLVAAVKYSAVVNEPVRSNPGEKARGRRVRPRRLPPTAVCTALPPCILVATPITGASSTICLGQIVKTTPIALPTAPRLLLLIMFVYVSINHRSVI